MLTCIRSKRQRDAAEYALRTIQSSCIRPYIKTIYLYGSCARGEEKYSSDVDLFLELSESFRSRPELKKYLYLLKSEVSSEELDDAMQQNLGESSKSPLHFAAHRDESVIVGYYTSEEVHLRSPSPLDEP